jgi:hypothetical protein
LPQFDFKIYLFTYWPKIDILENRWTRPPVKRISKELLREKIDEIVTR